MRDTPTSLTAGCRTLYQRGVVLARWNLVTFLAVSFGLIHAGPVSGQVPETALGGMDKEILDAVYSLDFEVAEAKSQILVENNPESARLWNLLASAISMEIVYKRQRRGLDRYMGNRRGSDASSDEYNLARETRLREVLDRVFELTENTLQEDPENIEALYSQGSAYLTLAIFEARVKRGYLAANRAGKKAREAHLRVLQLDPSYNDARLTVGTYDYTLGVIPRYMRVLVGFFLGLNGGDKEGGIQELEYAAQLGERGRTNAQMVLAAVYNREKDYDKSLSVLEALHTRYPRNFLLETSKASVYERLELWDDAVKTYETVLAKVAKGENGYDRLDAEPLVFKIGEVNVRRSKLDVALETFSTLVDSENLDVKGRAHLWIGKVYDAMEEREMALKEYEIVLSLNCSENLRDDARNFKRDPFAAE